MFEKEILKTPLQDAHFFVGGRRDIVSVSSAQENRFLNSVKLALQRHFKKQSPIVTDHQRGVKAAALQKNAPGDQGGAIIDNDVFEELSSDLPGRITGNFPLCGEFLPIGIDGLISPVTAGAFVFRIKSVEKPFHSVRIKHVIAVIESPEAMRAA